MKKIGVWLMSIALVLTMFTPGVRAAESADKPAVEFTLKTGSASAEINGTKTTIPKPYSDKGNTMVPLSLLTKAFGATLKFEKDKNITLTYGDKQVFFTIGSLDAKANGKAVKLTAAPKLVGGFAMVPLRVVTEAFGAKMSVSGDQSIVVTGVAAEETGKAGEGSIDSDAGKTMIGDGYYLWSMKYPTGLVQSYHSADENSVSFSDEKGTYFLNVYVEKMAQELSKDELLDELIGNYDEGDATIVDRKLVTSGSLPYAQAIMKDSDGVFNAVRAYYANGNYYEIYFSDSKAKNFKDLSKHDDLLNSFRPSFDQNNDKIKNLSTVEGGMRSASNADYGISLKVPADWSIYPEDLSFEDDKDSMLLMEVSSAKDGQTKEQWADQLEQALKESFLPKYMNVISTSAIKVDGRDAVVKKMEYTYSGDKWYTEYEVFWIEGEYKYYLEYSFLKENAAKVEPLFDTFVKSLKVDAAAVKDNFGYLEDPRAYVDRSKRGTKTSKKYNYSISIPSYWWLQGGKSSALEESKVEYTFPGGKFQITAVENTTDFAASLKTIQRVYNEATEANSNFKVVESTKTKFAGVDAQKYIIQSKESGVVLMMEQVVFEKKGVLYALLSVVNEVNRTDVQLKAVKDAFESFKFTS